MLKKEGHKIVIFIYAKSVPQSLRDEFESEHVAIVAVHGLQITRLHRLLIWLTHFLIWNKTTRRYFKYSRHHINRSKFENMVFLVCLRFFSFFAFLIKPAIRWFEYHVFPEKYQAVENYFDTYKPDLLFVTSITSKVDNIFLKAGKRRGIATAAMTKSWDNATKLFYRTIPDRFLVQNGLMKDALVRLQRVSEKSIDIVGFPQFDWYARTQLLWSREEYCEKMGLDPARKIIFFPSQGIWFPKDDNVVEYMHRWAKNDELSLPSQIVVRPHPTNADESPMRRFKGVDLIAYDGTFKSSKDFVDKWNPKEEEIVSFMNTLYHCDVVVLILSTITLDAACFDKPVINALFESIYKDGKDVTPFMDSTEHYQWILDTTATIPTYDAADLKEAINKCLEDPETKSDERKVLIKNLCYAADGKASERIANVILDMLKTV